MRAFEVYVNGQKVCTAGMPPTHGTVHGQLAVRLLTYSDYDRASVSAAGGDAETGERLSWPPVLFRLDDEVTIRLTETEDADPAERRLPPLQKGEPHPSPGFNPPYPQPEKRAGEGGQAP